MKKLVFVPIELMDERYSLQWYIWFNHYFDSGNCPYQDVHIILPNTNTDNTVARGEFLDVINTNKFKAQQLQQLCELMDADYIDKDTTILFMDAWFPGMEMLAYMRDGLRRPFKIVGMLHAGTWDKHDFLSRKGMRPWAKHVEACWFEIMDAVCVATQFHKDLILEEYPIVTSDGEFLDQRIQVTGFPILDTFSKEVKKENYIVFPHRIAPEKRPESFEQLTEKLHYYQSQNKNAGINYTALRSKYYTNNKSHYYDLLNRSKIAVSFSLQETFGIAMIESVLCGCFPIVPDRLSYAELYPKEFKYPSSDEMSEVDSVFEKIIDIHNRENYYRPLLTQLQIKFKELGNKAIPNIVAMCREVSND